MYHLLTVKRFQVLLFFTKNSIKDQSFVYSQLKDQAVLFLTIQINLNHLSAQFVKQFYLNHPIWRQPLRVRVDLGVMAMKWCYKSQGMKPHHQML